MTNPPNAPTPPVTMTLMEMACRDALTRDIPASERAFIQGMVDQAEKERGQ